MELPLLTGTHLAALEVSELPGAAYVRFSDGSYIAIECDWRIVGNGRVLLAAKDHRQLFGHQEPLDAVREGLKLLAGKKVTRASLADTGDVVVEFDGSICLETFTNSSGYESCSIKLSDGRQYIVAGGGEVVQF